MEMADIKVVGAPCGQHGAYTFYKAFMYAKNGVRRIVTLSEFFFVKLWMDSDLLCIGELQLLWSDKNSDQMLASLRLYFLPENTPEGRMDHGEDEVLAISEKVVLRLEDLFTWITVDAEWTWGRLATCEKDVKCPPNGTPICPTSLHTGSLDFADIEKERKLLPDDNISYDGTHVIVLSYQRYCRYRAIMRRLEGVDSAYLKYKTIRSLGGFAAPLRNTRVLFCRDTFDYPELEGHELLCNHLAPKLKGRPRGRRKKQRCVSPGSESNESESSVSNLFTASMKKTTITSSEMTTRNGLRCDTLRRSTRSAESNSESKRFLKALTTFMKRYHTPIGRIPCLGYKELDLYALFGKVQKLGGYDTVTGNRLWKSIFDEMAGHQNSTSAATIMRRHYERFLLPYERHMKGEEYKPLPAGIRKRLTTSSSTGKSASIPSDGEISDGDSRSSTPVPQLVTIPTIDNMEESLGALSTSSTSAKASSSLRSVRLKSERQKEKCPNENVIIEESNSSPDVKMEDLDAISASRKIEQHLEQPIGSLSALPDKNAEPVTCAVAPVVLKQCPEESGDDKDDSPVIKTGDIATRLDCKEADIVVEVPPYKKVNQTKLRTPSPAAMSPQLPPPPPPLLPPEITAPQAALFLNEFKKRKLDILKEGGLEVTPVMSTGGGRLSTVQPPPPVPATSKRKSNDAQLSPPPSTITSSKRVIVSVPRPTNGVLQDKSVNSFAFINGHQTPPKVVQSKSIYTYNESKVYGNPKDCLKPLPPAPQPQIITPKFKSSTASFNRQITGGDLLDLTVHSPQKATVEIVRLPPAHQASSYQPKSARFTPAVILNNHMNTSQNSNTFLEGSRRRLGSNLEITLVKPNYEHVKSVQKATKRPLHTTDLYNNKTTTTAAPKCPPNLHSTPPSANKYQKVATPQATYRSKETIPKTSYIMQHQTPPPQLPTCSPVPFTSYIQAGSNGTKKSTSLGGGIPPPPPTSAAYFPMIDPIYYSAAMQSLYGSGGCGGTTTVGGSMPPLNPTPPSLLPFPTTEQQLKFYTDLMTHSSRLNFSPYSMSFEGGPAAAAAAAAAAASMGLVSPTNNSHHYMQRP